MNGLVSLTGGTSFGPVTRVTSLNRRGFIVLPITRRLRFKQALRKAIAEKEGIAGSKKFAPVSSDSVFQKLDVPWWRNIFEWLLENWETVLKVLVSLLMLLETQ